MLQSTSSIESSSWAEGAEHPLDPFAVVCAALCMELAADWDRKVKQAIGGILLDELTTLRRLPREHDTGTVLRRVVALSRDIGGHVLGHLMGLRSIDDLQTFFETLQPLLRPTVVRPPDGPESYSYFQRDGILGRFLRRLLLAADQLSFDGLGRLLTDCREFVDDWDPSSGASEPTSSGRRPSTTTPGPRVSRAQAAQYVHHLVEQVQSGKALPDRWADSLPEGPPRIPETHYLRFLVALEDKKYEEAIDSLHRYFDREVFEPVPAAANPTPRPGPNSGIAAYGLLNLAGCEARFGHTDNAALCLQEAVRLAHQNGENHILQAVSLCPDLQSDRPSRGGNLPPVDPLGPNDDLRCLSSRRTIMAAQHLLTAGSSHEATATTPDGLDHDRGEEASVPRRMWRSLQSALKAAHAPSPFPEAGTATTPPAIATVGLYTEALLTAAQGWAVLAHHNLGQLTLDAVRSSSALPHQLQAALAAKARGLYTHAGDYEGALRVFGSIPAALVAQGASPTLNPLVAHTAYYILAHQAIASGHLAIARELLHRMRGLPGGIRTHTPGDPPKVGGGSDPELGRWLDSVAVEAEWCVAAHDLPGAWAAARRGLETAQAHRHEPEVARFTLQLARLGLRLPGPGYTPAVKLALRCVALTRSLSHIPLHIDGLLLLSHALLLSRDGGAAADVLTAVRRHLLRRCSKHQRATYHLLSAQGLFQRHNGHSFDSVGITVCADEGMNLDAPPPLATPALTAAALREGLAELSAAEALLESLGRQHDLQAVYHLRAGVHNALGCPAQRDQSSRQFLATTSLLWRRGTMALDPGGPVSPMDWVSAELLRHPNRDRTE
jgi:tetratricopeptide (TPR) repeat protein